PPAADADVHGGTADGGAWARAAAAVIEDVQADLIGAARRLGGRGVGEHRRLGAPGLQVVLQLILLSDHLLQITVSGRFGCGAHGFLLSHANLRRRIREWVTGNSIVIARKNSGGRSSLAV